MHGFFGEVMRGARQRRGLDAQAMANLIGRTPGEISSWESGRRPVSERVMLLFARSLELSLAGLFAEHVLAADKTLTHGGTDLPPGPVDLGFLPSVLRNASARRGFVQRDIARRLGNAQPNVQHWFTEEEGSLTEQTVCRILDALEVMPAQAIAEELLARGMIRKVVLDSVCS
jgi:transcriptional regulator with XRE-family HTH domain